MRLFLTTGAVLLAIAGSAVASECPTLIKEAEEALKTSTLGEEMVKKISDHIVQAKAEHDGGKHQESVVTAKDAIQLLGI